MHLQQFSMSQQHPETRGGNINRTLKKSRDCFVFTTQPQLTRLLQTPLCGSVCQEGFKLHGSYSTRKLYITQRSYGIHRFVNCINRHYSENDWPYSAWPRPGTGAPSQPTHPPTPTGPQPLISQVKPWINRVMPLINWLMPLMNRKYCWAQLKKPEII